MRTITLLLASLMSVMAGATIAPALPAIASRFALEDPGGLWVRLVLTLPGLFSALGAPLAGWLADRRGRTVLLRASLVVYGVGGGSGFWAESLPLLLAGRALLGLGMGGILTAVITLMGDHYEGGARRRVMGLQASSAGFGGVVFLLLGGFLAGWRWDGPFLVYLSAFAVLPLVLRHVRDAPRPAGDGPAEPAGGLPAQVLLIYLLGFSAMALFFVVPVQLPFHLEALGVESSARVGAILACFNLTTATVSLNYRRLEERLGRMGVFAWVHLAWTVGYLLIAVAQRPATVLAGCVVAGLGLGLLIPNLNTWASESVPLAWRGRAMGGLTTSYFLGQFASPLLLQPVESRFGVAGVFAGLAAPLGLLSLLFLFLAHPRRRPA